MRGVRFLTRLRLLTPLSRYGRPPPGRRRLPQFFCGLPILVLIISWSPPTTNCNGLPLATAVDHYELRIFEMRIIGWTTGPDGRPMPIYLRSRSLSTTATSVDVDPPVGGLVSWEGMWSAAWTLQPPIVVAITQGGNRSDQPCR